MKKLRMQSYIAAVFLLSLHGAGAKDYELKHQVSDELHSRVVAGLESISIPDHDYVNVTPREFIEYIREVARQSEGGLPVSIFFQTSLGNTPEHVSFTTQSDTFISALDKLCKATNLRWWIGEQALVIADSAEHK